MLRAVAIPVGAGFNLRVQATGPATAAEKMFTPARFGLFLALLVFAAFPQVIFGVETFVARDYGFFAYPLAYFQKECFWQGQLPFWDPYNNCGVPFLAQWNTMPLYPPALLYLLLPLHWSLSFFSLLHLWFAGLGMFFLARRWTANPIAAAFAGTVFAFNGLTLNLLMWPSHIATFSWLPWVVFAAERAWRDGGRSICVAVFCGAMQMLAGGPETIFLTWLITSVLWLSQLFRPGAQVVPQLWRFPAVVALVFCLSAPQLLPFLDLVAHAQRATGYTDLRWSMPGTGLANFFVPMAFGSTATEGIFFQRDQYWTSSYYLGVATLWLAGLTVFEWRNYRVRLLWLIAILGLLCALGEHTPFYPLLRRVVPQLSFITYPVKFVMTVTFAAPMLAAFALARLFPTAPLPSKLPDQAGPRYNLSKPLFIAGGAIGAIIAAVIVWTQLSRAEDYDAHAALLNGLSREGFLLAISAIFLAASRGLKLPLRRFLPLVLLLTVWLDVFTHEPTQNPTVPASVYTLNLARERLAMNPQPELGGSRAMLSPGSALELTRFAVSSAKNNFLAKRMGYCANVNLLDAVPKVDGFFSLTPRGFDTVLSRLYDDPQGRWSELERFMGVSQYAGYSTPDIIHRWQARTDYLPLVTAGQKPVFADDSAALQILAGNEFNATNSVLLPPEARSAVTVSNRTNVHISGLRWTNQRVDFDTQAAGNSLAVIAQTYYHDWRAEVDGLPVPLLPANVAFQALEIPVGAHHVQLFYVDHAFKIGVALALLAAVLCGRTWLLSARR
jgi:hypothetical protein